MRTHSATPRESISVQITLNHYRTDTDLFAWFFFLQTSDAYVRVAFCKQSAVTEVLTQTLCPTWDQTLIFDDVEIYESVENVAKSPPSVVVEVFDKDAVVRLHKINVKSSDTFEILNQKNWWGVVAIVDSGQYVCFVQIFSNTLKSKTLTPFVMVSVINIQEKSWGLKHGRSVLLHIGL